MSASFMGGAPLDPVVKMFRACTRRVREVRYGRAVLCKPRGVRTCAHKVRAPLSRPHGKYAGEGVGNDAIHVGPVGCRGIPDLVGAVAYRLAPPIPIGRHRTRLRVGVYVLAE